MDRFHVKSVAEHEGDVVQGAQVGDPVPGEHALDADHQSLAKGRQGAEQRLRPARQIAIADHRAGVVQDAHMHRPGVQVDATIEAVLLCVQSHHGLPVRATLRWVFDNFQHSC